jgi:O-antigen ligase
MGRVAIARICDKANMTTAPIQARSAACSAAKDSTQSQTSTVGAATLGFVALALCMMLIVVVGRAGELIPGAEKLRLAKVALVFVILGAVFGRQHLSRAAFTRSPIARTAFLFFTLGAASVLFSIWKSNSLSFVTGVLIVVVAIFALVFKIATNWRVIKAILVTFCICAAALALPAVLGYQGQRAEVGLTYDTNDLAYVLVTVMPICVAFAMAQGGWRRWLFAAAALLILWAALLTESRGGLLGLGAGVAALLLWKPAAPGGVRAKQSVGLLKRLQWVVVACVVAAVAWTFLPSQARERFSTMLNIKQDYNFQQEDVGRTFIWKRNMAAVMRRPIGYGIASSSALDGKLGGRYKTSHNSVVQVATELGLLGVLLFLRLYWLTWRSLGQLRYPADADPQTYIGVAGADAPLLLHGLRAAFVASFVAGFFLSQGFSYLLYAMFAIAAALVVLHPTTPEIAVHRRRPALPAGRK